MKTHDGWFGKLGSCCGTAALVLVIAGCGPATPPSKGDDRANAPLTPASTPPTPVQPATQAEPNAGVRAAATSLPPDVPGEASEPVIDPVIRATVFEIAQQYKSWPRASDDARWAIEMRRSDAPPRPTSSKSNDQATHGRKLFYSYAKDREAYYRLSYPSDEPTGEKSRTTSPVGQVLVKESWTAVPVDLTDGSKDASYFEIMVRDAQGKAHRPGDRGPLYIMYKVDPATPNTDEGWIYATLTPDGTKITEAGRIASCMACHVATPKDRLFGLSEDRPVLRPASDEGK